MKLLILSLLTSGAISAAVGGVGLGARAGTKVCNCNIRFSGGQSVSTRNIPTLPGKTKLNADYDVIVSPGRYLETYNDIRLKAVYK
ncbi:hypothetical protein WAI453_012711 [Rhynchosporium graminicola]